MAGEIFPVLVQRLYVGFFLLSLLVAPRALGQSLFNTTVDSSGKIGRHSYLIQLDGRPAIAYLDDETHYLKFVRASDMAGTSWEVPVTLVSSGYVYDEFSIVVVDGRPAIAYCEFKAGLRELKFMRAKDAAGAAWEDPILLDRANCIYPSMAIVQGVPMIAYLDYRTLKFVRAKDASGSSWNTPLTDRLLGSSAPISLVVSGGYPAVVVSFSTRLGFMRARDAVGSSWTNGVNVPAIGQPPVYGEALAIIDGRPAVSYWAPGRGLEFMRATDATGATWENPISVDPTMLGGRTSLGTINGLPVIVFHKYYTREIKLVRATDAAGAAWEDPVTVETETGDVDLSPSLAEINGRISVSYEKEGYQGNLKFAYLRDSRQRLTNLSSRLRVGPSDARMLIAGFVVGGSAPKRLLVRGIGPTLRNFDVADALPNPRFELFNAARERIAGNDNWSGSDTAAAAEQVGAFGVAEGTKDAALVATLAPGGYTMHLSGDTLGIALAEIYDAGQDPLGESPRLINLSARGFVEAGEGVLIGGFAITGAVPKRVLIRGVGPRLAEFGVSDALLDPQLTIFKDLTAIARNDDWGTGWPITAGQAVASARDIAAASQGVGAFGLVEGSKDAAVLMTLAPGSYTAQVTSATGATGAALVEIYEIPE